MENVMTSTKIIISYSACLRQYFYDFIFNYSIKGGALACAYILLILLAYVRTDL
jgi:hypothetical protein